MNDKVPVHNNTAMPIYVGTTMIPPNETRHFDLADVPEHLRPAPVVAEVEAPAADPMAELQTKSVKAVKAAIADLSDADLARLGELEAAAESPRTSVLDAISALQLERANAASG